MASPHRTGLVGALAPVVLVLGGLGAGLAVLDAAAREVATLPQEQRFATVPLLERAAGTRLRVPQYFPSSVAWPPSQVTLEGRSPRVAVLSLASRLQRPPQLFAQTLEDEPLPEGLSPQGRVTLRAQVSLGGVPAALTRTRAEDGTEWHQVVWQRGGRSFLLRSPGGLEELLKMASSVHGEPSP